MNLCKPRLSQTTPARFSVFQFVTTQMPIPSLLIKRVTLQLNKSVTRLNALYWKWLTEWVTITRNSETKITLLKYSPSAHKKKKWPLFTKTTKEPFMSLLKVLQIFWFHIALNSWTETVTRAKWQLNSLKAYTKRLEISLMNRWEPSYFHTNKFQVFLKNGMTLKEIFAFWV